jgi:hypothetical protein
MTTVVAQRELEYYGNEPIRARFETILRFKALAMVAIEDEWAGAVSAGIEFRFFEQFSVLADIVHFSYKHEREVPINGDVTNYDEYWQKDGRSYGAFELRYYPTFLKWGKFQLYFNGFSKIGKRFLHTENLYPLQDGEAERLNSSIRDFGTSIGFQAGSTWGFDLNLGAAYRNEIKSEDIFHTNGPTTYTSGVHDDRWLMNIRISLFFNLNKL